ncbi:hypothetical protein M9Y10_036805 [Tritrichomonas musculus]|uniref:DUF3447 domain-containing protein n=1 Tax=Tritrichomonas musculus TaxID=1915356 RepID=A0ABR2GUW6_9EUKA
MDYAQYIEQKKKLQSLLLNFVENKEEASEDYNLLIEEIRKQLNMEDGNDLREFLHLISNVTYYHHRQQGFIEKIEQIINYFKNDIRQILSNSRIYDIFKDNKMMLLILFRNNLLSVNQDFIYRIRNNDEENLFFYPEIKMFGKGEYWIARIEKKLLEYDPNIFLNFEKNRQKGENENFIAELIRKDLIKEFVEYYNTAFLTPFSEVKWSMFETNNFLMRKKMSIIEYACFYGSTKIFLFLLSKVNGIQIYESLWLCAIHSFNSQMIHIVEQKCQIRDNEYEDVFNEAIKCHHNDIALYILNNYIDEKSMKKSNSIIYQFQNYLFFPSQIIKKNIDDFCNLCKYDYYKLVEIYINAKVININEQNGVIFMLYSVLKN